MSNKKKTVKLVPSDLKETYFKIIQIIKFN